ncbi:MAG: carbohydrate kinase [Bacteroidetes bacterium CG2_30_33_31]|nr:MAG: carbohydrate kinase [Bacteroidetes bacterium CG2_30_33_31]
MSASNELRDLFHSFESKNIIVIGDVMVDSYIIGKVERISPEAPVPVVSVYKRYSRLGGAANVALNIKSLGANPILCSLVGKDAKGDEFISLLENENLAINGIVFSNQRITTTKYRVFGNTTQMLRVDEETTAMLNKKDFNSLIEKLNFILSTTHIDAIIFEDYDKGIIDKRLVNFVTQIAKKSNIIVTVDPKKKNFKFYKNVTLFKPNFKELCEGTNSNISCNDLESINKIANKLLIDNNIDNIVVTLSENGIMAIAKEESFHFKAEIRNIADVSGAGDTVISTITTALVAGFSLKKAVHLANIAGGLVCEEVGVIPINKEKLLKEASKIII